MRTVFQLLMCKFKSLRTKYKRIMSSVLILGDSIVKNFDTVKFDTLYEDDGGVRGGVNVFSYPGINAAKLAVQIRFRFALR